ncbi:white collar 2 type of transcription factor [Basidiobolus ranarum]|uniref:White collar 2 type of transcription factor n=1 Tax=Basidiobolus ranarum TaxID=34480 RepID=A0ABR2WKM8_9FUNG
MDSSFDTTFNQNYLKISPEEKKLSTFEDPSKFSLESAYFTPPQSSRSPSSSFLSSESSQRYNQEQPTKLTEFTKRKNWRNRIVSEFEDFHFVISPSYGFIYCSPSSQELVGYRPDELLGRNIMDFIHVDDVDTFVRKTNLSLVSKELYFYYRFRKKDDKFIMFEVHGHPYYRPGDLYPICFFCIGRPYASKASSMLDTFLELKIENELLQKRLSEFEGSSQDQPSIGENSKSKTGSPHMNSEKSPSSTGRSSIDLRGGNSDVSRRNLDNDDSSSGRENLCKPKAKKRKPSEDSQNHICTECGTVESPEWRKGPMGPKTLCNACGLRWAKKGK